MMLKDLVLKNRSYRGFDESVRISRETLEGFVDCARLCPSSVNKQPLKYFLAWEPEEVEKVQGLTKWARALPDMVLPHPGKRPTGFVVICQDKGIDENLSRYQKDVGIVAQTMLLAAVEQGLGGCMIGNFQAGEVMEVLGLPEAVSYTHLVINIREGPACRVSGSPPEKAKTAGMIMRPAMIAMAVSKISTLRVESSIEVSFFM